MYAGFTKHLCSLVQCVVSASHVAAADQNVGSVRPLLWGHCSWLEHLGFNDDLVLLGIVRRGLRQHDNARRCEVSCQVSDPCECLSIAIALIGCAVCWFEMHVTTRRSVLHKDSCVVNQPLKQMVDSI